MGLIRAFEGSIRGTFADQWKEIITAGPFDEHTVVVPGIRVRTDNRGRGENQKSSNGVISAGSKIFVPENTAAFLFSQSGIETIVTEPGGYTYEKGPDSVFAGGTASRSVVREAGRRIGFGGIAEHEKKIAFVNLREIRSIPFGTKGAQIYHDRFYGADLEVMAYGLFSVRVVDPILFIRNFVPANHLFYSLDSQRARSQLVAELIQSFTEALNELSLQFRVSQIPSQSSELSEAIIRDERNAGSWPNRFGLTIVNVAVENIELSETSKRLVNQFNYNRMKVKAYEGISPETSGIAAQQKIADGIREHGLGGAGGSILSVNYAQQAASGAAPSATGVAGAREEELTKFVAQIEEIKQWKSLKESGIITEEEFEAKKKQILGL